LHYGIADQQHIMFRLTLILDQTLVLTGVVWELGTKKSDFIDIFGGELQNGLF